MKTNCCEGCRLICQSNSSEEACANEESMISIDHNDFLVERKKNQEIVTDRKPAKFAEFRTIRQFAQGTRDAAVRVD